MVQMAMSYLQKASSPISVFFAQQRKQFKRYYVILPNTW